MPRLYRPHIPLKVRCAVAARQLGWGGDSMLLELHAGRYGSLLENLLERLASTLECGAQDLRLDHDPPLGARPRRRSGLGKNRYVPDANDPEHLLYRPHGPQFAGSHLVKTNIRGDHGQHPDRVLIKKQRRLERGPKPKRGPKIQSRGFASKAGAKPSGPKRKLGKRSFGRR